jgi:hypothetical protein
MPNRAELLEAIAGTIADYRSGEIDPPTPHHIETWLRQFDKPVQIPILAELNHVLSKTYYSRERVEKFLLGVIRSEKLVGVNPRLYWLTVNFLRIQQLGNSQREMLVMFDALLQRECGVSIEMCGSESGPYFYLDDAVFGGGHVRKDVIDWVKGIAPQTGKLNIVTIAYHSGGKWYAEKTISEACRTAGKKIEVSWWRSLTIESFRDESTVDVLRPTMIPADVLTEEYARGLDHPPVFRKGSSLGRNKFFSSPEGRHVLEQEFLARGVYIRSICPNLNEFQRPLGNMLLQSLGFGALLVTFRNCPNNCPLVFWAGNPWYPLFPRKTN